MKNKLCYADTDPRMQTFDGKPWTASLAGEFVMYRDTQKENSSKYLKLFSFIFVKFQ